MEFTFEAKIVLKLEHKEGRETSEHISTNFGLAVSGNLDKSHYFNDDESPNEEGVKALSNTLVQGLVASIHYAHEAEIRDSAEHLRWIISELERGFISVVEISKSEFK